MLVFFLSAGFLIRTGDVTLLAGNFVWLCQSSSVSTRCALVPAFFPKNVCGVSPIGMNQSSVKAALFPVMGPV